MAFFGVFGIVGLTGLTRLPFLGRAATMGPTENIVPVIDLKGTIMDDMSRSPFPSRSPNLNIDGLRDTIDGAFGKRGAVAVALNINCPGGSPTQSELIANHIRHDAESTKLPVYAFVQDVAASGGYWLACAADKIYVAKTSMVGSIGVIAGGMAFPDLMERLGVEYREHTAGESKSRLSPFKEEKPEDVAWLKALMSDTHDMFKEWVRERRGEKLSTQENLFNGNVWHGKSAVELGLADGIGEMVPVLRKEFGDSVAIVPMEEKKKGLMALFNRLASGGLSAEGIGAGIAAETVRQAKNEVLWQPYNFR